MRKNQRHHLKGTIATCLGVFLGLSGWAFATPATFGLSPDNSLELVESVLNSARKNLTINIYQFEHPKVLEMIQNRIQEGVKVQILVEGDGWALKPEGEKVLKKLKATMARKKGGHHLYLMGAPKNGAHRRFKLDHAKYIVADGNTAWISSENFSMNPLPEAGDIGNRGWQVVLQDAKIIQELQNTFNSDTDMSFGDIKDLTTTLDAEAVTEVVPTSEPVTKKRKTPAIPIGQGDVQSAALVMSPHSENGIQHFIQSAKQNLELEFMSLPNRWKDESGNDIYSPIVNQIIAAARRGVGVRVLLNDPSTFAKEPPRKGAPLSPNEFTVALLQRLSICENLKMAAKIVNTKGAEITYIHNKGILADQKYSFVSSINGTQQSVMLNREVGVILESKDAHDYFLEAFDFDWEKSPDYKLKGPLNCRDKSNPTQSRPQEVFFLDEAFQEPALSF